MSGSFLPSLWSSTNHSLLGSREPALLCNQVKSGQIHISGNACQLRWSTQHWREVYSQEFEILVSFLDVDSSAARPGRAALAKNRTGRCLEENIGAAADWCFRSCHAARGSADRRSKPAHR